MGFGGHYVLNKGFAAAGAISKFQFVTLVAGQSDPRQVAAADSAGELVLGVCQDEITAGNATEGRIANIALMGVSLVESGAAVTQGAEVATDATGRAIAATTGHRKAGIALDAAGGAGEWIAVLLTPAGETSA